MQNFAVALALLPAGLVLLPISVRALSAFAGIHAAVARALLTTSRESELNARVVDLRTSQARIIAAADAERRRLERDLHDGAQQRLVAVALNLRVAASGSSAATTRSTSSTRPATRPSARSASCATSRAASTRAVLTERGLGPGAARRRRPLPGAGRP